MDANLLQLTVNEQYEYFKSKNTGILRNVVLNQYLETTRIVIISGIRRCGKSTLMLQLAKNFPDFHYVTFDDERFIDFNVSDFQDLLTILHKRSDCKTLFFDEIQNIPQWEKFVRRIHDQGYKVFITGSNANLLSSELATHLTGRYLKIDLYPFSFLEIIKSKNINYLNLTTQMKALVLSNLDQYIENGGFPEWQIVQNRELLQRIYDDIIYRDVIVRYKVQEVKSLKQLSQYMMTNLAKEFSYQSVTKFLQIKSISSVKNYIEFLESVFLVFEVYKYDYSLKKQYVSNKKIYNIDSGLRNMVSFKHSSDTGRLLENIVFLELKRRQKNIFYFKKNHECDFILEDKGKITDIMQVCLYLNDENRAREISGILEAAEIFNLKDAIILTYDKEDVIKLENVDIHIIPVWKWLLELSF